MPLVSFGGGGGKGLGGATFLLVVVGVKLRIANFCHAAEQLGWIRLGDLADADNRRSQGLRVDFSLRDPR